MRLNDPNFIAFDGTPITGRVPSTVIVANDVTPTPGQEAGVAHAYKLFCDAKRVSIPGYLVENRFLQDGTRVRIVSNSGIDTVLMWPVFAEGKTLTSLRGFIVAPMFVDGHAVDARYDTDFLALIDVDNKWMPYKKGYEIGAKREAFPYTVSRTAWAGHPNLVNLAKPNFKGYEGKRVRGNVSPVSDDKYNDVFTLIGAALYKNAIEVKKFGSAPTGVPCVFDLGGSYAVIFVSDNAVAIPNGAGGFTSMLDWNSLYLPTLDGYSFSGGPELHATDTERKARYLGYNVVATTKAVQWWRATADLTSAAPFAATASASGQIGTPGALADMTPYTRTTAALRGPFVTPVTAQAMKLGFLYSNDTGGYAGDLGGSGTVLNDAGGGNMDDAFSKTYSLPETMPLNETESISIERSVSVMATVRYNSITVQPLTPDIITQDTSNYPAPFLATWISNPYQPPIPAGSPYGFAYSESCERLEESDNSVCQATVPNLPEKLYDVSVGHLTNGINGNGTNHELGPPPAGFGISVKPPGGISHQYIVDKGYYGGTVIDVASSQYSRTELFTFSAKARDYIFSDRANDVHLYIEALISGSSNGSATSAAIMLNACLRFNGATHTTAIYSGTGTGPIGTIAPWGVNFTSDPLIWGYHAPARPSPIYAPRWQEQGLCPYIAYTTPNEAVNNQCIEAFFRLQLLRTVRGIGEADTPSLPNVVGFPIYMCEQAMNNYCINAAAVINTFEAAPLIVKFTSPDASLFANIGAPNDDAAQYAKLSRT